MAKAKTTNQTIGMTEDKQVARPSKRFWFPDQGHVEAQTAQEAGEKLNNK